jgi:hypothetical protein
MHEYLVKIIIEFNINYNILQLDTGKTIRAAHVEEIRATNSKSRLHRIVGMNIK